MKALSIRQPWAFLIVNGIKDIENRTWPTKFRGEFLIHTGKQIDMAGAHFIHKAFSISLDIRRLPLGGIVGKAEVTDCVTWDMSEWFEGPYGLVIRKAKVLEFRPLRGHLGFFTVPEMGYENRCPVCSTLLTANNWCRLCGLYQTPRTN